MRDIESPPTLDPVVKSWIAEADKGTDQAEKIIVEEKVQHFLKVLRLRVAIYAARRTETVYLDVEEAAAMYNAAKKGVHGHYTCFKSDESENLKSSIDAISKSKQEMRFLMIFPRSQTGPETVPGNYFIRSDTIH